MKPAGLRCAILLLGAAATLAAFPVRARAQFVNVASGALAHNGAGFGAAWGDFDRDGDEDLVFTDGGGTSCLLRNDPGSVFVDVTDSTVAGVGADIGVGWADYNNDGNLDLYMTNAAWSNRLLTNQGGITFVQSDGGSAPSGLAQSAAWGDYNNDGLVDLFVTYWDLPNKLYRNLGGGVFLDVTPASLADPQKNTGAAWGDYDNDGDLDLYVGGRNQGRLFRNDGNGQFVDVTTGSLVKVGVTGAAWGDYDNDGDLDLFTTRDLGSCRLYRNDGAAGFVDMNIPVIRISAIAVGVSWIDSDNDGDLDVFIATAGADNASGDRSYLFRNNLGDSFTEIGSGPLLELTNSRGIAVGDFDGNGTEDVYMVNWGEPNQLLSNVHPIDKWLEVRLFGTLSNKSGIGARIRVKAEGKWQMREISGGSGIYSQNSLVAHFGFGYYATTVDSLVVSWPSGTVNVLTGVSTNQRLDLGENGLPVGIADGPRAFTGIARLLPNAPNPFSLNTSIRYELGKEAAVELRVLDLNGRVVRVLERDPARPAGSYQATWNGRDDLGLQVAGGVYFYSLTAGPYRETRRLVIVR